MAFYRIFCVLFFYGASHNNHCTDFQKCNKAVAFRASGCRPDFLVGFSPMDNAPPGFQSLKERVSGRQRIGRRIPQLGALFHPMCGIVDEFG